MSEEELVNVGEKYKYEISEDVENESSSKNSIVIVEEPAPIPRRCRMIRRKVKKKNENKQKRKQVYTKDEKMNAVNLAQYETPEEVAHHMGCCPQTVRNWIAENNYSHPTPILSMRKGRNLLPRKRRIKEFTEEDVSPNNSESQQEEEEEKEEEEEEEEEGDTDKDKGLFYLRIESGLISLNQTEWNMFYLNRKTLNVRFEVSLCSQLE